MSYFMNKVKYFAYLPPQSNNGGSEKGKKNIFLSLVLDTNLSWIIQILKHNTLQNFSEFFNHKSGLLKL
jgi:hypothetical protein